MPTSIPKKKARIILDCPVEKLCNINLNLEAPDAGSDCHFRLSSLILRDKEVIATNAFFSKIPGSVFCQTQSFNILIT